MQKTINEQKIGDSQNTKREKGFDSNEILTFRDNKQ